MNRFFFLIFLFTGICLSQNFNAGIICGINTSQVSGDNLSGFNKLGVRLGGFVNRDLGSFITQLELQYINKGSREYINNEKYEEGYRFEINYIEIPCLVKKKLSEKHLLEAGISIAYILNWSEQINGYLEPGIELNKLDYNIHFGIDYKIVNNLYLNTRLSNSFLPIRKHGSGQTYKWNRGQYNTCLSFVLLYIIKK
mgnify:CR=1 FL=1